MPWTRAVKTTEGITPSAVPTSLFLSMLAMCSHMAREFFISPAVPLAIGICVGKSFGRPSSLKTGITSTVSANSLCLSLDPPSNNFALNLFAKDARVDQTRTVANAIVQD
jgi:hypothetical protein